MSEKLEWTPEDSTTDGRFGIHSEHVRGESRFYWLEYGDDECAAMARSMGIDGAYDKRTVKRAAQRVSDAVARKGADR